MNICILSVCHNSYKESLDFLKSLKKAVQNSDVDLDLYFIDNSSIKDRELITKIKKDFSPLIKINYLSCQNLGYFPSINFAISNQSINLKEYDLAILSNVDLSVDKDFFKNLKEIDINNKLGVIAPSIISKDINADRNPKILKRPSKTKLTILKNLFRFKLTYMLLRYISNARIKYQNKPSTQISRNRKYSNFGKKIYAGHGSFIILSNNYLNIDSHIDYPVFLFGEEIYIAEKSAENALDVIYYPKLVIYDNEHSSTSQMKSASYRKSNFVALSYIIENYKF